MKFIFIMTALPMLMLLLQASLQGARAAAAVATQEPDYGKALDLGWLFYEGQQSGELPCWNRDAWWTASGWRVSAHLDDGKAIQKDLTGGFYDAGDHLKVTLPLAFALSTLAWGVQEFSAAYTAMGQYEIARRNIRWGTDWLIKAHIVASDDPAANVVVAQVGDPGTDHAYWWKPNDEPAGFCRSVIQADKNHPAADVAASAAAALAAAAPLFQDDTAYQATLLSHAKQLYSFAVKYPALWKVRSGETIYNSTSYLDDIALAAAWLCKSEASFCSVAVQKWNDALPSCRYLINIDWNNVFPQATTLLLSLGVGSQQDIVSYRQVMENKMLQWTDTSKICTGVVQAFRGCYSPKGLMYMTDWGNVPRVAQANLVALIYSQYVITPSLRRQYRCWARGQLRLMLGDYGQSFLVGFGTTYPQHIHNRAASCPRSTCTPCTLHPYAASTFLQGDPKNPNVHSGALVGGPGYEDVYNDTVANYQQNEAALDSNSGFTSAMAGMVSYTARMPSTMTWASYCDTNNDITSEPLLPTPSFSGFVVPDPVAVLVQARCAQGPNGPNGTCNSTSTRAVGVSLACTPQLDSNGAAAGRGAALQLVAALAAVLVAAVFGAQL